MKHFLRQAKCSKGNVAITFALSAVPLVVAAGVALDYMRLSNTRSHLQSAVDAAVLAVALSPEKGNSALNAVATN